MVHVDSITNRGEQLLLYIEVREEIVGITVGK